MHVVLEAPANALDLCKDGSKVVVAGRSVFKIFSVEEEFVETAGGLPPAPAEEASTEQAVEPEE